MYAPSEDSHLLAEILKKHLKNKNQKIKILDLGAGTGIQTETCKNLGFNSILAADTDKEAISLLRKKGFKAVESNLFSNIKNKFDLIIFNPPYLPEDKYDKEKDTTGGKKGYETILEFLKQAKQHLNKNGEILLLFSSLSTPSIIKQRAKKLYKIKLLARKKLFFEKIFVYLLQ